MMKSYKNIDAYIADYPKNVQAILKKIRQTVHKEAPSASEAIKYGIPTFVLGGKNLVHFGGFKEHVGFFPTPGPISAMKKELAPYVGGKGSIKFPLDEPIPYPLINKIVKLRIKQLTK